MSDPILVCLLCHGAAAGLPAVADALPERVAGHAVQVLAIRAGTAADSPSPTTPIDTITLSPDTGLGTLAQVALDAGRPHHAAAVVLLDPNGEYDASQLPDLVIPVLDQDADYVVGSRFLRTRPRAMARRRRVGNRVLTAWVRRHTRLSVTDGQSGFRALSAAAAEAADIVHDFNHTQVLTLDLVAKGFRYHEVPVRTVPRATSATWFRLLPYLRQVRRGVRRQLRTTAEVTAFGGPLDLSPDPSDLVSPETEIDLRSSTEADAGHRADAG